MRTRTRWMLLGGALAALGIFALARTVCISAWWKYRLVLHHCPDGALRQTLNLQANNLRRGAVGQLPEELLTDDERRFLLKVIKSGALLEDEQFPIATKIFKSFLLERFLNRPLMVWLKAPDVESP